MVRAVASATRGGLASVGRYGGDEFVFYLTAADERGAAAACRRVLAAVRAAGLRVTVSVGAANVTASGSSVGEAVRRASEMARKAKKRGKDGFVVDWER